MRRFFCDFLSCFIHIDGVDLFSLLYHISLFTYALVYLAVLLMNTRALFIFFLFLLKLFYYVLIKIFVVL